MSITFLPTEGTWTACLYYRSDDVDSVNGIYTASDQEPNVQCHNSGGLSIISHFGLTGEWSDSYEDNYCGSFPAEGIEALLSRVSEDVVPTHQWDRDYIARKRESFEQMLLHCKRHNCGFTWW